MHIRINDKRNANFPVTIAVMSATALYDTEANMSCMSYTWYAKLKDPHLCRTYMHYLFIL